MRSVLTHLYVWVGRNLRAITVGTDTVDVQGKSRGTTVEIHPPPPFGVQRLPGPGAVQAACRAGRRVVRRWLLVET